MDNALIDRLIKDLKNPDEQIRERATATLWQIWFNQKGDYGLEILAESQALLEGGRLPEAEAILTELLEDQ
ncbi:MAG TPA: hypothetical protein V6C65_11235, partial [Allocoleopsis sp.]